MAYQRFPQEPYPPSGYGTQYPPPSAPPPSGYPSSAPPPPGYPSSAPAYEGYPPPLPPGPLRSGYEGGYGYPPPQGYPGYPPRPEGYQSYFNDGYYPPPQQPQAQVYDHQHYQSQNDSAGCFSFLQGCFAALCCCCLLEECFLPF